MTPFRTRAAGRHLILLLLLILPLGSAQDDDLYPDPPPADAAFIRLIHADPNTEATTVTVGSQRFPSIAYGEATDYYVVLEGERTIALAEMSFDTLIEAGFFYTLVLVPADNGPTVHPIKDGMLTNRAKALLALYNLSDRASVDLKTADASVDVLVGVVPLHQAAIEVNAIAVDLGIFESGELLARFDAVQLERGGVYSMVIFGTGEATGTLLRLTRTVLE